MSARLPAIALLLSGCVGPDLLVKITPAAGVNSVGLTACEGTHRQLTSVIVAGGSGPRTVGIFLAGGGKEKATLAVLVSGAKSYCAELDVTSTGSRGELDLTAGDTALTLGRCEGATCSGVRDVCACAR